MELCPCGSWLPIQLKTEDHTAVGLATKIKEIFATTLVVDEPVSLPDDADETNPHDNDRLVLDNLHTQLSREQTALSDEIVDRMIAEKVIGCVIDGGSAGKRAASILNLKSTHCMAHIIQLALKDFCTLPEVSKELALCRAIASCVKKSCKARSAIGKIEIGSKTRFDSLVNVMRQLLAKKNTLRRYVMEIRGTHERISHLTTKSKKIVEAVTYVDWVMLKRIISVLSPAVGLTQ